MLLPASKGVPSQPMDSRLSPDIILLIHVCFKGFFHSLPGLLGCLTSGVKRNYGEGARHRNAPGAIVSEALSFFLNDQYQLL